MRNAVTSYQIYPALKALLGLPDMCTSFELRALADGLVTVSCEHYLAADGAGLAQLERVFSEFELVRHPDKGPRPEVFADAECELAEEIDFDAWMRTRTDRAHAEFMHRTAELPIKVDVSRSMAADIEKAFRALNLDGASEFTLKRYRDLVSLVSDGGQASAGASKVVPTR